jgi:Membrane protein involved in colicin uptake
MDISALQLTLRRFAAELLQVADQASISLHPGPGTKTHVLVDWENVQPNEAECRALVPEATDVWLFHGPSQKNVGRGYATFGDRVTPVGIARTGKNALDFHLSFYMGYIAAKDPGSRLVVLSNDKGYGPMLEHAKELGFIASQSGFGGAKVARRARKAPAKKAAAKQAPAKKKAAAAPAARKAAAKKTAPAQKRRTPKTPAAPGAKTSRAAKTSATAKKSFEQVLAILKKSAAASRPRKHARLLGYLASRVGAESGADAQAMLDRLVAEGKITVDDKWNVSYHL